MHLVSKSVDGVLTRYEFIVSFPCGVEKQEQVGGLQASLVFLCSTSDRKKVKK